jgi:valyl-tRNA synthetase
VPIPVWYRLDESGEPDYDDPITPDESQLPIDPSTDVPPGYRNDQRGQPAGFIGDPDVFDTWATSSLTPQIAGRWEEDPALFANVFPMDLRPQSHDIIRTWLFATVVRSHHEFGSPPWHHAALSGWILDPDRKKMSKSKGNVVTPMALFDQYGTDAVRYWSGSARPGVDTAFSEDQMKVGRKLANKLLNVSKFVLGFGPVEGDDASMDVVDQSMLARLDGVIAEATTAFESFDYARALERTESFFWWFCDDYVELVKGRAYGSRGDAAAASARTALRSALDTLLRLLAPIMPFASEEAWSWWHDASVHLASWPAPLAAGGDPELLDPVCEVMSEVRRAKTEAKQSQRAEVAELRVWAPAERRAAIGAGRADLADAGSILAITVHEGEELRCEVVLSPSTRDAPTG